MESVVNSLLSPDDPLASEVYDNDPDNSEFLSTLSFVTVGVLNYDCVNILQYILTFCLLMFMYVCISCSWLYEH